MKNKWYFKFSFLFSLMLMCANVNSQESHDLLNNRWKTEKIQNWYDKQPWLIGCNYAPATAINQIEMWSKDTFDPKQINKELAWVHDLGFNTLRVF